MNDIDKLPRWAKERIRYLEMERNEAVKALNRYLDEQSESQFFTEDYLCTGESVGPISKRRYIQTPRSVSVKDGVHDFELGFDNNKRLVLRCNTGRLRLNPEASNAVIIDAQ